MAEQPTTPTPAIQPTPPGQPTAPGQGGATSQGAPPGHATEPTPPAEHTVLLDLARQLRQAPRHDDQTTRTVILTEAEATAMADALEQLAPRLQGTTPSAPPGGRLQPEARR